MKIGINGFGRIGKNTLKALMERYPDIHIVAINDLGSPQMHAHLLAHDSTYGSWGHAVDYDATSLRIDDRPIHVFQEKDPTKIPWQQCQVDVVIESTGLFTDATKARAHITDGGAKKVVISAPAKNEDLTVVMGVNHQAYEPHQHHIISNASCTTNCLASALKPVVDTFGWKKGFMTTIHAYTNDQNLLDGPHKDLRRARAGAVNIIPTSSGAAKALYLTIPQVKDTFDGFALRVPVPTVSMCYLVAHLQRPCSREELNKTLIEASGTAALSGILAVSDAPLVSSDLRGSSASATVDLALTQVQDDLAQLCVWYDNEWGYASRLADCVAMIGRG